MLRWIVRRSLTVLTLVAMVRWLETVTRPAVTGRCPSCPHRSPHREHSVNGHGHLRVVP